MFVNQDCIYPTFDKDDLNKYSRNNAMTQKKANVQQATISATNAEGENSCFSFAAKRY